MTISIIKAIGAAGLVLVTSAALPECNNDSRSSTSAHSTAIVTSAAPSARPVALIAGPELPADFPLPPGLSSCKPIDAGGEIICEWQNVDVRAIYNFYLEALPKAGYTLLGGFQKAPPPDYHGPLSLGFKKGSAQGAVTVVGGKLTIQYLPHR
jgi:hypothetical protein